MSFRPIAETWTSQPTLEGAGVRLRRAFGFHATRAVDPFLLLDDFRGDRPEDYLPGFPWHPHRGIETITFMLEGSVEHGDSLGNEGVIGPGGVQWMTAGGGIIHQEMPKPGDGGRMGGFQLWANLPADHKLMRPRYQEYTAAELPVAELPGGGSAIVVCGTLAGVTGPVENAVIDPGYFVLTLPAGAALERPLDAGYTALSHVFGGRVRFGGADAAAHPEHTLVRFERDDPAPIRAEAVGGPARLLLMTGRPLGEPVAWHGPIVMNTQDELRAAYQQLQDGTFLDDRSGG